MIFLEQITLKLIFFTCKSNKVDQSASTCFKFCHNPLSFRVKRTFLSQAWYFKIHFPYMYIDSMPRPGDRLQIDSFASEIPCHHKTYLSTGDYSTLHLDLAL